VEPKNGTFQDWQQKHFLDYELALGELTGPEADANGNGLPNWVEYAFGLDPKTPNQPPSLAPVVEGNGFTFTYRRPRLVSDVSYEVLVAERLEGPWLPAQALHQVTAAEHGIETVRVTVALSGANYGFLRLRARLMIEP
jgi:hypothetical protein